MIHSTVCSDSYRNCLPYAGDSDENLGWMGSQSGRGGLVIAYGSLKENVLLLFGHFGFAYLVMY